MSKTLRIADGLALPLSAVTEKLAWLGRTGSGKTYGAMKLAELMLEHGAQIGVLDPVGVWRALRVPAKDGRAFEVVVFGGLYGDVPLEPCAGKLIADLVVDRGLSFVLDVSQFIPSEQQTFAAAFAHQFFHRKKSAPSAVHLFLEECQEFIPENPSGREAITLGEFQRLWKLGRNFGIGGSLISQRPQEIAKKALNMSGTLFAFQMTGPQERKAIRAWVADQGVAVDIEGVLQKLSVGEPHVESPTFLQVSKTVHILPRVTADLSSTPTVGGTTAAKRPLTPIDVEQLRTHMAETIERAKADDPKELRKELASVRQELKRAQQVTPSSQQASPQPKAVEILTEADRERLTAHRAQLVAIAEELGQKSAGIIGEAEAKIESVVARTVERLGALLADQRAEFEATLQRAGFTRILDKLDRVTSAAPTAVNHSPQRREHGARPIAGFAGVTTRPRISSMASPAAGPGESMPPGEKAVLTACAMYADGVSRNQIGVLTGYKRSSRDAYIARLAQKGWVESGVNGSVTATAAGVQALGADFEPLPTGAALLDWWRQRLPQGECAVLDVLVAEAGKPVAREVIDERTSFKRSSRDAYLSRLSARRLVQTAGRGEVRASAELFD